MGWDELNIAGGLEIYGWLFGGWGSVLVDGNAAGTIYHGEKSGFWEEMEI